MPNSSNYKSLKDYSNNSWSNVKVYTIASSTDSGSGGIKYYYTTTGRTANVTDENGQDRNIQTLGTSQIKYKACDAVGNCSAYSGTYTIRIDIAGPTVTLNPTGGTYTNKLSVSYSCVDDVSGVQSQSIDFNGKKYYSSFDITEAVSNKTATATCTDQAGNTTTVSRTYTVVKGCPASSSVFGTDRNKPSGNSAADKTYSNSYWGNWCYSGNTTCNASFGYARICIADWCKGLTAKEVNDKYGCNYSKYWCTC